MKPQPDLEIHTAAVSDLVPYAHNAKLHSQLQVGQIADSMREFGNCDPIAVWHNPQGDMEIVEGHGRVLALQRLGIDTCPVIYLDHLSDEQRRAYTHVHNQLTLNSGFDMSILESDLDSLDFDWGNFGFDSQGNDWFENRKKWDDQKGDSAEHDVFLEKFENKKTTDDCYTPDNVYEAVADWVASEYNIDRASMVRPFYPGGDYESYHYPEGCCVVDNPPFSILAEILKFYCKNGIRFFLFAPTLTLFSSNQPVCYLPCGAQIVYENKANVNTSFITNLDDARIKTVPTLYEAIEAANKANIRKQSKELASYEYPNEVIAAAQTARLSKYGVELSIAKDECVKVTALDAQKEEGKAIFGSGFLVSKQAAAKQAAAKEVTYWELSERERAIIEKLGGTHAED